MSPDASVEPVPPVPLNVLSANTTAPVFVLTGIVQTTGLDPVQPGDDDERLATTAVPPFALTDADIADEALDGTVTSTSAVTAVDGMSDASSVSVETTALNGLTAACCAGCGSAGVGVTA